MKKIFAQFGRFGFTALALLACLGVAPTAARADISEATWTFNDVTFSVGSWNSVTNSEVYAPVASLSGSFSTSTDDGVMTVTDFSDLKITAEPGDGQYEFQITGIDDAYLPNTIGIHNSDWSSFIDLYLTKPLTSAGNSDSFSGGFDCPGCAVLDGGAGLSGAPGGAQLSTGTLAVVTPEPALYALVTLGLSGLLFAVSRRRRASGIA